MKRNLLYTGLFPLTLALLLTACGGGGDGAAPPPSWTGTKQFGTTFDDEAYGVAVDGSGNTYVTGYTHGGLDGNINAGFYDFFLVKYDSFGTKLWTKQLGTAGMDIARDVAVDGSGNAYVTGWTEGSLDGNINAGVEDLFLVKYDPSGTKLWTKQLGTSNIDQAYGVAVDGSGNAYVTGDTSGGLDGNTSAGGADLFLVKYDPSGSKLWTKQLGSASLDYARDVAVDGSGNAYVTGYTYGSLDGNNAGSPDLFLVKYDPSGTKLWTKQIGTAEFDIANGVAVDGRGNAYVTGGTDGGLDGNTSAGRIDAFVVSYTSNGVKR